jgi:TonB family protein
MPMAKAKHCSRLALLLLPFASAAFGQNVAIQSANPPAYNGARETVDGAHIPAIPGLSFSARVELETAQTLANGTTVTHRTYNIIARDFRGRTHNEFRYWINPPNGTEAKLNYTVLYDPDTRTCTFVYPAARLARQFILKTDVLAPPQANKTVTNPLAPAIQKEDMGINFLDGLQLTGIRETRTYPPGSIGNDQPVAITNEYWYSPDLHLNISVKRTDPRFGIQTLQLTGIRREEPDASLFEVPPDYKLVNENGPTDNAASADANGVPRDPNASNAARLRVGGNVQSAKLLNRVQPAYPEEALRNRIQGTVRLHLILQKDGTVGQLEVVSGHPLLAQAALDAVRQWRYQPTLLNGNPVEIDTTVDVIFMLNSLPSANP